MYVVVVLLLAGGGVVAVYVVVVARSRRSRTQLRTILAGSSPRDSPGALCILRRNSWLRTSLWLRLLGKSKYPDLVDSRHPRTSSSI